MDVKSIFSLEITDIYYIAFILTIWLLFWPVAKIKKRAIFHNSSLVASFTEEIIFRGILLSAILYFTQSWWKALVFSSVIFGFAHMRNVWWAGWGRAFQNSLYNTFYSGPLFGGLFLYFQSIYPVILVHFLHNLYVILTAKNIPTDDELKQKARRIISR